jgi:hypothetical protein
MLDIRLMNKPTGIIETSTYHQHMQQMAVTHIWLLRANQFEINHYTNTNNNGTGDKP